MQEYDLVCPSIARTKRALERANISITSYILTDSEGVLYVDSSNYAIVLCANQEGELPTEQVVVSKH